ncbi:unnamed protein product [Prorocentrum cordatum]|uniref:Uncharacterized protein n=1 Tax=Prorocentrum cordatum TaxID=2364126 RepID=A0ABN9PAA8_9DINO|nr:unnamed protein product [Polarella glacialis]
MRRGEELAGWQSTFAAVIYGPSLYFYTHGIALVIAVVFHKHQGAEHPPTLIKVVNVLRKADPMYMLQIAVFGAALAAANLLPPKLDHGCESWLEACTKGLYAGHITMLTMSAINAVALGVAYNIVKRKVDRPPRPSYESALVWATGCLATFIWCEMFVPGRIEWIALEVYHRAAGHRLALRYHWGLRGYVLWPHGDEHDGGGRNALLGVHSVHPGSRAGASRCHITPRARRLVDTWPLESPRRVRTLRVRAHRNARLGHEDHRGDRTLAHQGWSRELAEASPRQVGQAG